MAVTGLAVPLRGEGRPQEEGVKSRCDRQARLELGREVGEPVDAAHAESARLFNGATDQGHSLVDDQQVRTLPPDEAHKKRVETLVVEPIEKPQAGPQPARNEEGAVIERDHLVPQTHERRDQVLRKRLEAGIEGTRQDNLHGRPPAPRTAAGSAARGERSGRRAATSAAASWRAKAPVTEATAHAVPPSASPSVRRRRSASARVTHTAPHPETRRRSAAAATRPAPAHMSGAGNARMVPPVSAGAARPEPIVSRPADRMAPASAEAATPGAPSKGARATASAKIGRASCRERV